MGSYDKVFVVINGGTENRFRENVRRAAALYKKMGYRVHVANPGSPGAIPADMYYPGTMSGAARLLKDLRYKRIRELAVYFGGHGGTAKPGCSAHSDGCWNYKDLVKHLRKIRSRRRVIISAQCFGGKKAPHVLQRSSRLFISSSSSNLPSYAVKYFFSSTYDSFSTRFFEDGATIMANGGDLNKDRRITYRERFLYATKGSIVRQSFPLYLSHGYPDRGIKASGRYKAPFAAKSVTVKNEQGLSNAMKDVAQGRLAVILYAGDDRKSKKMVRRMAWWARIHGGKYKFIVVKIDAKKQASLKRYGMAFPAMILASNRGLRMHKVKNLRNPLAEMGHLAHLNVNLLAYALRDPNDDVRKQAVKALISFGKKAVPALAIALGDDDSGIREIAAKALSKIGAPAVPWLIKMLRSPKEDAKRAAIKILGKIGPAARAASPHLVKLFKSGGYYVEDEAAEALGKIGVYDLASVKLLIAEYKNHTYSYRGDHIAKALSKAGRVALKPLIQGLKSSDSYTRKLSLKLLVKFGKAAAPALPVVAALFTKTSYYYGYSSSWKIAKLMVAIGEDSIPYVIKILNGKSEHLQGVSMWMLRQFNPSIVSKYPTIFPSLKKIMEDDSTVDSKRWNAAGTLAHFKGRTIKLLFGELSSKDAMTRRLAAWALGKIGDPSAKLGLLYRFKDADEDVRWQAANAVVKIGKPAIPMLLEYLKKGDPVTRSMCAYALGKIKKLPRKVVPALALAMKDKNSDVQYRAADALGSFGSFALLVFTQLGAMFKKGTEHERKVAAAALKKLGRTATHIFLEALRENTTRATKILAIRALGDIKPVAYASVTELIKVLKTGDNIMKRYASNALSTMGAAAKRALPALRALTKHTDQFVRFFAKSAIQSIESDIKYKRYLKRLKRSK